MNKQCGLSDLERKTRPWGIPTILLQQDKSIQDNSPEIPIKVTLLERLIIDSPAMQRLKRLFQLGTTHQIYHTATHNRFSHSLGCLNQAQNLLDIVQENSTSEDFRPNFIYEQKEKLKEEYEEREQSSSVEDFRKQQSNPFPATEFHHWNAKAIVLTRIGALLHDICHLPFGHTLEDDLELLTSHDENTDRFNNLFDKKLLRYLVEILATNLELYTALEDEFACIKQNSDLDNTPLFKYFNETKRYTSETLKENYLNACKLIHHIFYSNRLKQALSPMIVSKDKGKKLEANAFIFSRFVYDIVGNTICADLLDYVPRDHKNCGIPLNLGNKFLSHFYVSSATDPFYKERMVMKITKKNQEIRYATNDIFKFLRYRYELSERVLYHKTKIAADLMLGK